MVERIEVVNESGCRHNVTPDQLELFLEAGWVKTQPEPEKPTPKKKSK